MHDTIDVMDENNTYKYELKIQGLTEMVNNLNNTVMDLRVELTFREQQMKELSLQIEELTQENNVFKENEAASGGTETSESD